MRVNGHNVRVAERHQQHTVGDLRADIGERHQRQFSMHVRQCYSVGRRRRRRTDAFQPLDAISF